MERREHENKLRPTRSTVGTRCSGEDDNAGSKPKAKEEFNFFLLQLHLRRTYAGFYDLGTSVRNKGVQKEMLHTWILH